MLYPQSEAHNDKLLEYLDFLRLQAIAARDKEFLSSHSEDWYHEIKAPYTLVKYAPFEQFNKGSIDSELYLTPHVKMEKVSPPHAENPSIFLDYEPKRGDEGILKYDDKFKRDWDASSFSGYFQLPNFSFSRQHQQRSTAESEAGQYCYQTHFDVDDLTVLFGGLVVNASQSLRSLGIPRLTDLSRISVHFPCDLPPHINKHLLMSPYVMHNPDLILFNAMKSTVRAETIDVCSKVHPGNICAMEGTLLNDTHIFFCGGFEVLVEKVEYKAELNRWLIYKTVKLNPHGYIFDIRTKLFTKIKIKSSSETHYEGVFGNAMVSNRLEKLSSRFRRAALPELPPLYQNDISSSQYPSVAETISASTLGKTPAHSQKNHGNLTKDQQSPTVRYAQPNASRHEQKNKTFSAGSATSARHLSRLNTDLTRSSSRTFPRANESRGSGTTISPTSSATESSLKMTSMLMKSARIFHRTSHHHSASHSQGANSLSTSSSSGHPSQSQNLASLRTGSTSPAPIPQNTYSNQVKQHRSQRLLSSTSTDSTSPARHMTLSPIANSTPIQKEYIESVDDEGSILSGVSDSAERVKFDPATIGPEEGKPAERTISPDDSTSVASALSEGALTTKDSAIETGVLSVSVFVFGGFVRFIGDDNRIHFKATNDLLRLELIVEDSETNTFHKEALIFDATDRDEHRFWPTKRGFFAHVLVNSELSSDSCSLQWNTYDTIAHEPVKSHLFATDTDGIHSESSAKFSMLSTESYLNKKSLLIQGGVNENNEVCSDIFIFNFTTFTWHKHQSYAYDYHGVPKQPFEDEQTDLLTLEEASIKPPLVEAELRACHHHALLYEQDKKEYVLFVGGFTNDYLRHFDAEPYTSDRYDVSRLARFSITTTNPDLLRVPALNLRTQTWVFLRFFFDLRESISRPAMDLLMGNENFRNCRMSFYGGGYSITGKQITMCHGMVEYVSEKAENFGKYKEELQSNIFMSGCHCHLTYPSL